MFLVSSAGIRSIIKKFPAPSGQEIFCFLSVRDAHSLQGPLRADEAVPEPRTKFPLHHRVLAGGRIDHHAVSEINRYVAIHADDVAALEIIDVRDRRIICASPSRRRPVRNVVSAFTQAIVDQA